MTRLRLFLLPALLGLACLTNPGVGLTADRPSVRFPSFQMQEIDRSLGVGYAVLLLDVNGDGKKDILVVDKTRVVWYENPTWTRHLIIENQTKPDNVCFCAHDIDGDGKFDLFLGADWNPSNTKTGGTLQWLKRGKTLNERWTVYPIGEEPTVHRIRMADLDGSGKPQLLVGPLFGRNSTREKNWMDAPLRLLAYKIPANPMTDRWEPEVIDQSLHVMHNFFPVPALERQGTGHPDRQLRGCASPDAHADRLEKDQDRRWQPGQPQEQPRGQRDQARPPQGRQALYRHHRALARQPGSGLHASRLGRRTLEAARAGRQTQVGSCRLAGRHRWRRR